MKIAVAVYGAPERSSIDIAARFAESALRQGHEVLSLFFYHEAVRAGWSQQIPDFLSSGTLERLESLGVPLQVCVGASERRGLSQRADDGNRMHHAFESVGLGQFIDAISRADRGIPSITAEAAS